MLGIKDAWVFSAYILCIASALLCLVYGAVKWNSDGDAEGGEQARWAKEEQKLGKGL